MTQYCAIDGRLIHSLDELPEGTHTVEVWRTPELPEAVSALVNGQHIVLHKPQLEALLPTLDRDMAIRTLMAFAGWSYSQAESYIDQ
jgi:hypothetical protein